MRILFLVTSINQPSFRFRVQPTLAYFEQHGHACEVDTLPESRIHRLWSLRRVRDFDAVFVMKRTFCHLEMSLLRRWARILIYDFDDAVMFDHHGQARLKHRSRFQEMVLAADLVICGNSYLEAEARRYSQRVVTIPTVIDVNRFQSQPRVANLTPIVGWTGSHSTNPYLNSLLPVLARFGGRLEVRVMSSDPTNLNFGQLGRVRHSFVEWSATSEVFVTASFDIGVMPLPNDNWSRGKCGCKALQYMALGVPAVCSPVGVNEEIVRPGVNGFLASSDGEWYDVLDRLVSDPDLRYRVGQAGRETVEKYYSLDVHGRRLVEVVEQAVASGRTNPRCSVA